MRLRRFLPALLLVLFALPAPAGATSAESVELRSAAASASAAAPAPGRVIHTRRSWQCTGALRRYGRLPIKVVSRIPNPGRGDAIRLIGCRGDGDPKTVDLILDVRGNGRGVGTAYDAVKVGQSSHDLVITGRANCGRSGAIHQDAVQVMSGERIKFVRFRSGNPREHRWTCWGAGGGFFISHVNGTRPNRVVCVRCRIAAYNQSMRVHSSVRSGARRSIFGFVRSHGIVIMREAVRPVNERNRVIRFR
ncbi:MAG TPA: hypothetical protein VFR63_07910 [Gaiellaceae bacterium]|nr:hypothetical protein [Gaiellaceae bacterium]